jgi:hypothetical protein
MKPKNIILVSALMLSAFAATSISFAASADKHQVMMYNDSNVDISYWFDIDFTTAGGLKAGQSGVYTTGGRNIVPGSEESVVIDAGTCTEFAADGSCLSPVKMKNCIAGNWNLLKMKAIHISSPSACTVVCNDGDTTSCLATTKAKHVNR